MKWPVVFTVILLFATTSCSKKKLEEKAFEPSTMNKYFEDYILNKDFTISEARYQGRDTGGLFTGYTFKLLKNSYYDGPFEARVSNRLYTGSWQCNEDYSKLNLFINKSDTLNWISISWKFKSKSFDVLELVPWFNTDGERYVKFSK